jgi:hypothetical protein
MKAMRSIKRFTTNVNGPHRAVRPMESLTRSGGAGVLWLALAALMTSCTTEEIPSPGLILTGLQTEENTAGMAIGLVGDYDDEAQWEAATLAHTDAVYYQVRIDGRPAFFGDQPLMLSQGTAGF